jgi:hypothetical protein
MSLRTICLLSCVVALCACFESRGLEQGEPAEPIQEGDYKARRADAEHSQADRCCEEAGAIGIADGYRDAVMRGVEEDRPMGDSGARYDPQAAGECVAAIEASACRNIKDVHADATLAACGRIYTRGNRTLGQSCKQWADCAESTEGEMTCSVAEVTQEGLVYECMLFVRLREGDDCVSGDRRVDVECELPLLCDEVIGRCVSPAERGAPCLTGPSWGDTCAEGSVCDRTGSKRCVEPIPVGDACEDGELCEGLACADGVCRTPTEYISWCSW